MPKPRSRPRGVTDREGNNMNALLGFLNLGAQEIVILLLCGGGFVVAAGVVVVVVLLSTGKKDQRPNDRDERS